MGEPNSLFLIREYLNPLINLDELKWAYPSNGIHESIDWMCNRLPSYQVFEGEYRYPTFIKRPINVAKTIDDILPNIPLYMSNPFSATGNFDSRYHEVCDRYDIPIYLDLAFVGSTGPFKLKLYPIEVILLPLLFKMFFVSLCPCIAT